MMEHWKDEVTRLGYWIIGLMVITVLTTKFKMDNILKKPHYSIIPLFLYFYPVKLFFYFTGAMIEAEAQTSDNTRYFH